MTSDRRHSRDNSDTVSGTNSANTFPSGYGQNTAISNPEVSTLSEAAKSIRIEDFKKIHKYPCARDAFLTGIGGGFGIGGLRAMFGASVFKTCSWTVGTFCFTSIATYEYCLYRRRAEKRNLKRVVEILDQKRAEKQAEQARTKAESDERHGIRVEANKGVHEPSRSSWRFW